MTHWVSACPLLSSFCFRFLLKCSLKTSLGYGTICDWPLNIVKKWSRVSHVHSYKIKLLVTEIDWGFVYFSCWCWGHTDRSHSVLSQEFMNRLLTTYNRYRSDTGAGPTARSSWIDSSPHTTDIGQSQGTGLTARGSWTDSSPHTHNHTGQSQGTGLTARGSWTDSSPHTTDTINHTGQSQGTGPTSRGAWTGS